MLVGNVYLDVRVKDTDIKNTITPDNLEVFQIVETSGASLPYVYVRFFTQSDKVGGSFLENNPVNILIGESEEKAETFTVLPFPAKNPKTTDPSGDTWTIEISGFIGNNSYMMDRNNSRAFNGTSLMAVKEALKEYKGINPEIDTDITKTKENQVTWRQTGDEATSSFVVSTLLHMDIRPSFPLFAFDKYGQFHVRDYKKLLRKGASWKFVSHTPEKSDQIQYINNFNIKSYKSSYNMYSGFNKVTEICDAVTGLSEFDINENEPVLASTEEAEQLPSGNRMALNKIKSGNVHKTYMEAYAHNTDKLVSLSSMMGVLNLIGYYPQLKPTDLVRVNTNKGKGTDSCLAGKYLIDSIVVSYEQKKSRETISTYVYVSRDNNNNVENYIASKKRGLRIRKDFIQELADAVYRSRVAMATCAQIVDGTFLKKMRAFVTITKVNLLKMFSISGIMIDFTQQAMFLQSLLCIANTLMNALLGMIFPESVARVFRDFLIVKPSLRDSLAKYIEMYVPFEIQGLISSLVDSLLGIHTSLNSIAKDNGITAREIPKVPKDNTEYVEKEDRVAAIIKEFENNTTGLDIPFPIIELTESQELMSQQELTDYVATQTVANLETSGYLEGVNIPTFTKILLGETPIDFSIIEKINANAGNKFNYRFWGTYGPSNEALYAWSSVKEDGTIGEEIVYTKKAEVTEYTRFYNADYTPYTEDFFKLEKDGDVYKIVYEEFEGTKEAVRDYDKDVNSTALSQLTSFYINKGYKDRYRTIPCTKLISALGNSRLYFACPQSEKNLKFYINSRRVVLESFPIDLGYTDSLGNKIMYNVYFTETGYNSNSTLFEVRQGN